MTEKALFDQVALAVRMSKLPLLVAHRKPDGDTLGSMLAFGLYLDAIGKPHARFCVDRPDKALLFLSGADKVIQDQDAVRAASPDLIVTFDAGDLRMTSAEELIRGLVTRNSQLVNIDHHATNENFGTINVVITDASSTAEVVSRYLTHIGHPTSPEIATCLLAGLTTDTWNFTNPATTASALEVGAKLITAGAKRSAVLANIFHNKPVGLLKLWGTALDRLKFDAESGIASTAVFHEDAQAAGVAETSNEEISNTLSLLLNVPVIMVLRTTPDGKVKGSLRTTRDIDVSRIASYYGGGGHRKAAGFMTTGKIVEHPSGWQIVR